MEIVPLAGGFGAELRGLDCGAAPGRLPGDAILAAFHRHQVLLVRGQQLSAEGQLAFARLFGELEVVRTVPEIVGTGQHVMHVSNRPVDGMEGVLPDGEMQFHADQCYYERPCKVTLLFAIRVPCSGGNTRYLDASRAYQALPEEMKTGLRGLEALHVYDYAANATVRARESSPQAPRFQHPVVVVHPVTGRPSLYVNRLMTHRILGLAEQESGRLLADLFAHMEREEFIHEHVWRPGDLVLWDNRCTLHARTDFDPAEVRTLRRVTVKGERPRGLGAGEAPAAGSAVAN